MKLITNIQSPFLSDILFETVTKFKNIKAAVAYCENYKLFEYCKRHKIKLDYYGRLDESINLNLKKLKSFLTDDISVHVIGGNKFHPKVIWCCNYGIYIGSANLTQSAWKTNIECGLWLTQKELVENHFIDPLEDFFEYIKKNSTPLSRISDFTIQEINKHKKKIQPNKEDLQILKKLEIPVFNGCSNNKPPHKKELNSQSSYRKGYNWNDCNEMRCLLILKKCEAENFPKGKQSELCREMANIPNIGLSERKIGSRVSDYKKLAEGKKDSHASQNTRRIYNEYKDTPIEQLKEKTEQICKTICH